MRKSLPSPMKALLRRLLRAFPAYRTLLADYERVEAQLAAVADRHIEAQDRIRDLTGRLLETTEQLALSRAGEVRAVQAVADWMSQYTFGRKIFAGVPDLPESPSQITDVEMDHPIQARRLCDQLEREFEGKFNRRGESE